MKLKFDKVLKQNEYELLNRKGGGAAASLTVVKTSMFWNKFYSNLA